MTQLEMTTSTEAPVPYYHHKNGSFRRDILPDPPR